MNKTASARTRRICELIRTAPWLTQAQIAEQVGCSQQAVSKVYLREAGGPLLPEYPRIKRV